MRSILRVMLLAGLAWMLAACATGEEKEGEPEGFQLKNIAKSDIDMVAEIHVNRSLEHLRNLARKLYLRNPNQLARSGAKDLESTLDMLFDLKRQGALESLDNKRSTEAIYLAFQPGFEGDRVAALIEGLRSMTMDAYGGKTEFYVTDEMDPQKLYYLARNYEIAFWKLTHDLDADGNLILISNELQGEVINLSFERLFGKLISLQDAMALVVADKENRRIKNVIQGVASMVFFPI